MIVRSYVVDCFSTEVAGRSAVVSGADCEGDSSLTASPLILRRH